VGTFSKLKYLRIVVSIILFSFILFFLNWQDIKKAIIKADARILLVAFSLHIIGLLISVIRWQVLLKAVGIKENFKNLLVIYWVSLFYNLFLPTSIGGDLVRVYDLNRATGKLEGSIASVIMDRLTGMIVLLSIALAAILFNAKLYNPKLLFLTTILLLVFIVFFALLIFEKTRTVFKVMVPSKILKFMHSKLNQFLNAFNYYKTNYKVLVITIIWGIFLQFNVILYFYLIGKSLRIGLDFVHYCIAIPIIQVVTLIPVSLSGIGVREAATITILSSFNAKSELAFSLSVLGFILAVAFNSIGGIFQAKLHEIKMIEKEIRNKGVEKG
jgi:uncharacterized protein (TIRG00374 family)